MARTKPGVGGSMHRFFCNRCDQTAGQPPYEEDARTQAQDVARADGWEWRHPGWGLLCPRCLQSEVRA